MYAVQCAQKAGVGHIVLICIYVVFGNMHTLEKEGIQIISGCMADSILRTNPTRVENLS